MSEWNPYVSNLADNRKEITTKMRFVLDTYLGEAITAHNDRWGGNILYPRTINLNVNSMDLKNGTDQFPALSIVAGRSRTEPADALGTNVDIIDYNIISSTVCDAADINFNVDQSQALALCTANLMERYLVDGPDSIGGTSTYRVDQVASSDGQPRSIGNGLWLLTYTATIRVYSRAQSQYEPAYLSSSVVIPPSVPSNYWFSGSAVWRADAAGLTTGSQNQMAALEVPSASTTYDLFFQSNIPSGSSTIVTVQRDNKTVETLNVNFTGSGTAISIVPDTAPQTSDVWTVSVIVSGTNNFLTFPARITVV